MQEHLQILQEQYRTEHFGPWHTRESYPWKYNVQVQECINLAKSHFSTEESRNWLLHQAKIFQERANYIRQE